MADVFLHGVRKWGKPSVEIEQAVIDGGERQISQLKKRLRVLNGVATLSPLIGLLGTVIGMIQAFNDIAESNGSKSSLFSENFVSFNFFGSFAFAPFFGSMEKFSSSNN